MEHDVFISYSSKHKEAADAVCHIMEQQNIRCWIAPRDIPGGIAYGDIIENAITSCKIVVLIYSRSAQESKWVNSEINLAFDQNKTIIPFKVEDAPAKGQIKLMLNQKHWIDAYPDYKEKFQELIMSVSNALGIQMPQSETISSKHHRQSKTTRIIGSCIIALIFISTITFTGIHYLKPAQDPAPNEQTDSYLKCLSIRRLTEDDIKGKTKEELTEMRNYIYARHGYEFRQKKLREYFEQFQWYKATTKDAIAVYKQMSDIERYNVEYIRKYELKEQQTKLDSL